MRERAPSARGVRGSRKHRRQAKCAGAILITVSWDYRCARETASGVGETTVWQAGKNSRRASTGLGVKRTKPTVITSVLSTKVGVAVANRRMRATEPLASVRLRTELPLALVAPPSQADLPASPLLIRGGPGQRGERRCIAPASPSRVAPPSASCSFSVDLRPRMAQLAIERFTQA